MVRYAGSKSTPTYCCGRAAAAYAEPLCQHLSSGAVLDDWIAAQVLAAVQSAALEASLAAEADIERERGELLRHWQLRRERARYETDRAVPSVSSLRTRESAGPAQLERQWEESLRRQRQVDEEFERWRRSSPARLSADDRRGDPPGGGSAHRLAGGHDDARRAATDRPPSGGTDGLDRGPDGSSFEVQVTWVGGHEQRQTLSRRVRCYQQQSDYPRLVARCVN